MIKKNYFICVNEFFLNRTVKHVTLQGYSFVGRRDRSDGGLGGEIVAFAVYAFAGRIILIQSFDDAERFGPWCTQPNARVLSEFGTGRGLPGDLVTINTFKTKLSALDGISLVTILCGTPTSTIRGVYDTPEQPVLMKLR